MFFNKRIYILFFCFVFAVSITAQDRSKAIPLKDILQSIEKQHHVYFNYIDNEIVVFKIVPPKKSLSLNKKINYLQKKTNLFFENIDNKSITIFSNNALDTKNICGYVFSKEDNSPLENVNIRFENGVGTSTNKKGYFELKKENLTDLLVSCIGFTTKKISVSDLQNKNSQKIYIEVEVSKLNNIITNHFLTPGISKKNDGTFEIKPKRLGILPGLIESDVLQTMLQIPGIYSTDESISSINVRGGTHDQNLFLWNGIKMYQTGHFFGLISAFNPNLAHTISITKNGSSAFFGESVSSVVDISSNPNKFEKNSFGAGINMINADIYSKFNITKKGFLEISGRKSIADLVKTPTYEEYYNKAFQNTSITNFSNNQNVDYTSDEKFNFYDITVKYFQNIGRKDHLILDFITINDQLKVFQSTRINTIIQSENNILYQKNYGGNLSWKRNWNAKNSSNINVYSSFYELDAKKNKIQDNQTVKQENKVLDNGFKLENSHIINSKFTFNNGYQLNEIGTINLDEVNSPIYYRRIKEVLRTHALIVEGKFNDTLSKIYFNTGLRLNYIEKFKKFLFEPRLQFNYAITKHFNLEVLGEFKSQNCYQIIDLQKDYFGIEKRRWILANNTTMPIQKSKQASISLSYIKNNWLFTLENFYKKVTGINSSSQGFQNQLEFVKTNGDYEVLGVEVLVQKKINHFITWLSYTYNNNNYHFPDLEQPVFSNNFKLDQIISWAGIYERKNLKIALGSKWYSGKPETTPMSSAINYSNSSNPKIDYNTPNNKVLDDFFQVNFSTTYKWESLNEIQYKLGFSLLNVFNRKNEINEYYRINTITNSIEDVKIFSLRRTPNLSFRITY
ncbi:carboxypeptidase-like regulatory domain-containing protein [Flavobacterium sp. AED]|uniref:TonB-dependent receptor n=1 Tax=Flavobacterium sp. AED TaxID=1423323 RepID=UPI00057E7FA8|nr:carboxypeptidase-like regulatory domain-containing protein [Flavobacterium sp. AED]KIA82434.1 TonB-dependent receptor [Flavobacterium sp. AED]